MIFDTPIIAGSLHWQREITEWEQDQPYDPDYMETCADDTYQASLLTAVGAGSEAVPKLVAAIPTQEAAGADEDAVQRDRPLAGGETLGALSAYALAMMGLDGMCE